MSYSQVLRRRRLVPELIVGQRYCGAKNADFCEFDWFRIDRYKGRDLQLLYLTSWNAFGISLGGGSIWGAKMVHVVELYLLSRWDSPGRDITTFMVTGI